MNRKDLAWFVRTLVVLLLPLIIAYIVGFFQSPMVIGAGEGLGSEGGNVSSDVKSAWFFGAFAELPWLLVYPFIALRENPQKGRGKNE